MFKKLFFSSLLLIVVLSACREPKDLVFRDFKNLKLEDVSFNSAALVVDLIYYNPNNFGLELRRTDLEVFVDSTYLGRSLQDIQVRIPRRNEFTVPLRIDLDMKNLLKNGLIALSGREVNVRVVGKAKVSKAGVMKNFNVDYSTKQVFSLFK